MSQQSQVLVIAAPGELPPEQRIWGTGGWQEPEARAALDWLTLVALLGWGATVSDAHTVADRGVPTAMRWIILACPDEWITAETTAALKAHLRHRATLVIAGAGKAGRPLAELAGVSCDSGGSTGRDLTWSGPGERRYWRLRRDIESPALAVGDGANVWAQLDGGPLVVARGQDRGTVATIGFDASAARDRAGAVSAFLKHMLVAGAHGPVAWLDLADTMVLRMDDPGASQNLHLQGWRYTQLDCHAWTRIGNTLQRAEARLSVGYVAGWVDDGDPARGKLEVGGAAAARRAGAVHPSPGIRYVAADGSVNDYMAQYRKLMELQQRGLVGIEMHGFSHMHAALARWARADDRYDAVAWYREFSADAAAARAATTGERGPLADAAAALHRHFGVMPTTLIFPGEAFTDASLAAALDLGIELIGSYYLALRRGGRFCWVQHVCAPYLDEPDTAWLDAELPTVGYFHDRDIAIEGPEWFASHLEGWTAAGIRRFIDYRELAAALARPFSLTSDTTGCMLLNIENANVPTMVRPLPIRLRVPDSALPRTVMVSTTAGSSLAVVTPEGPATGTMHLPVDAVAGEMTRLPA